jgi:hypothetical protein
MRVVVLLNPVERKNGFDCHKPAPYWVHKSVISQLSTSHCLSPEQSVPGLTTGSTDAKRAEMQVQIGNI